MRASELPGSVPTPCLQFLTLQAPSCGSECLFLGQTICSLIPLLVLQGVRKNSRDEPWDGQTWSRVPYLSLRGRGKSCCPTQRSGPRLPAHRAKGLHPEFWGPSSSLSGPGLACSPNGTRSPLMQVAGASAENSPSCKCCHMLFCSLCPVLTGDRGSTLARRPLDPLWHLHWGLI